MGVVAMVGLKKCSHCESTPCVFHSIAEIKKYKEHIGEFANSLEPLSLILLSKKLKKQDIQLQSYDDRIQTTDILNMHVINSFYKFKNNYYLLETTMQKANHIEEVVDFLSKKFSLQLTPDTVCDLIHFNLCSIKYDFIRDLHYCFEHFFANTLRTLLKMEDEPFKKKYRTFTKINEKLFEGLYPDDSESKIEPFQVLTHIRNSFHNNGYHENATFPSAGKPSISINHKIFKFIAGEEVDCASWDHINSLTKELFNIYEAILFHGRIQKEPIIEDKFRKKKFLESISLR